MERHCGIYPGKRYHQLFGHRARLIGRSAKRTLEPLHTIRLYSIQAICLVNFRFRTPQVATGVSKYGAYFVLSDELAGSTQKLGRPPEFNWDELQLELARRAVKGDLPIKQEAFYEDMRNWCQSQWGRVPGETSLKGKIRPYYYEFVRPEESQKIA